MLDPTLDDYADKYRHIRLRREGGVLEVAVHSDGKSLEWGIEPHAELGLCFADIAADRENHVVILTGTGEAFCERMMKGTGGMKFGPAQFDMVYSHAKRLLNNLLSIEVPIIAAVNGPAHIHAELALFSDIVLAAEHATFRDAPHFPSGLVPGDGVHILWPALLGPNRGRYFLLTGQTLSAREALDLGVVSEVLSAAKLMDRARSLAAMILQRPLLARRYARDVTTHEYKRLLHNLLGYGLALEGLGAVEHWPEKFE